MQKIAQGQVNDLLADQDGNVEGIQVDSCKAPKNGLRWIIWKNNNMSIIFINVHLWTGCHSTAITKAIYPAKQIRAASAARI